jgi:RNA polymerase sigma-70 factor (ECF subfamily)
MTQPSILFDDLAERHRPEILAYLTRLLGDAHDAEDACQETLLRAFRAFDRLAPHSNPRAWLYKIATNTAFNALKRQKRHAAHTVDMDPDTLSSDSAASIEERQQLRAVVTAVNALPPKQRAALMMRQFQGLRYEEIAASLGGSQATARANVYQAIQKLREMLVE